MFRLSMAGAVMATSIFAADGLSSQDKKFMTDASAAGIMEIQMARMGQDGGHSDAVKTFSQRMIEDHSKADSELKALANSKKVTLPLDESATKGNQMMGMAGGEFDHEFAKKAVADHEKAVALFKQEAKSGSDPDVKAWAAATLPTLQSHLDAAKALPTK